MSPFTRLNTHSWNGCGIFYNWNIALFDKIVATFAIETRGCFSIWTCLLWNVIVSVVFLSPQIHTRPWFRLLKRMQYRLLWPWRPRPPLLSSWYRFTTYSSVLQNSCNSTNTQVQISRLYIVSSVRLLNRSGFYSKSRINSIHFYNDYETSFLMTFLFIILNWKSCCENSSYFHCF